MAPGLPTGPIREECMTWVRLDEDYATHPKVVQLSDKAARAHVTWLCWCNKHLTDGLIPKKILPKRVAKELLEAGLLEDRGDSWFLHDYFDYQPSREQIEAEREAKAAAGRKGGKRSGETRKRKAKQKGSKPQAPASTEPKQVLPENGSEPPAETKPDPVSDPPDEPTGEPPPAPVRSKPPKRARPRDRLSESFDPPGVKPEIVEVFDDWREICGKPNATLEPHDSRAYAIRDKLAELTREDLQRVFRAARQDEWCQEIGCKLSVILENRERFDELLERGTSVEREASYLEELEQLDRAGGAS